MEFNSYAFIILFSITILFYNILKGNYRKYILLLASAVFIGYYHLAFLAVAIGLSTLTYFGAKLISCAKTEKRQSLWFNISVILNLLALGGFKYIVFIQDNILQLIGGFGLDLPPLVNKVFLPLGISFYVFQSISYLIEVYWEEQEVEENYFDFMLYMLFFMKFISGPIERPQDFLPQIKSKYTFNYYQVVSGLQLIGIGLFKKLVIADRLAPYLNDIFSSVHNYSGAQLVMATFIYPIQLYADFSGYTDMAIGGARIFGFELSPNFNRPFIAKTITDFWRRWHMSLSFWVRDYIYEPLAASRRAWRQWGVMYALVITFVLLGLWHGASWNFIIYGLIQGVVVCYEMKTSRIRNKLDKRFPKLFGIYSILRTYILFSLSLLFFRIEKFSDVIYMFKHSVDGISTSFKELNLGMNDHNIIIFFSALLLIFVFEYFQDKSDILSKLSKKHIIIRWTAYYCLAFIILLCGVFDSGDFIYIQF